MPSAYVYFDHNATSALDARVREAMLPWLGERHGNPSSAHRAGQAAREAVEGARERVAALLGADPLDVVLAGSGTEVNNAVVWEIARAAGFRGEILAASFEHPSVLRAAERCAGLGMTVRTVAPDAAGVVPAAALRAALREETRLACLMLANNELGTLQPVAEVAAACREAEVPLLCDATQAAGKVPVGVAALGADYVVLAGHKMHGPLGAAALWVRPGAFFEGHQVGGSQERRRRAGTVDVPAVVGFGAACELAREELPRRHAHLLALRERFEEGLRAIPDATVQGRGAPRLPHTTHVRFAGVLGQDLAIRLDLAGFAVSTGAACHSGAVEASAALLAMGLSRQEALGALRVSFGVPNTLDEVEAFLPVLAREVAALRAAGSLAATGRRVETYAAGGPAR